MGDITGRSITRTQVSLSRPACAPEALLGRSNIGQGKCRDTERICFTAVPAVCEVASCYEHVWGGRTCPGVLIVAGPPFFSEKCSFLAALTYLSFSHCAAVALRGISKKRKVVAAQRAAMSLRAQQCSPVADHLDG